MMGSELVQLLLKFMILFEKLRCFGCGFEWVRGLRGEEFSYVFPIFEGCRKGCGEVIRVSFGIAEFLDFCFEDGGVRGVGEDGENFLKGPPEVVLFLGFCAEFKSLKPQLGVFLIQLVESFY